MVRRVALLIALPTALPFCVAPALAQRRVPEPVVAPNVAWTADVQYAEGFAKEPRRNRLDVFVPKPRAADGPGAPKPPLVMFVHGGTWTGGCKEMGAPVAQALCARGVACAPINTQLRPFAEPAAMVADCGRALRWLHDHAAELGVDGDRLFLMGHSSGAHLVTWLALDDARREATGVPRAAIAGCIGLSGVYELRVRDVALDKVFGEDQAVRAAASPFVHASAGDPPTFLLWGERDIVRLPLCARMLRDRLRDVGVPVVAAELPGRDHVDYVAMLGRPGDAVLDRIVAFVARPPAATASAPSRALAAAMPEAGAGEGSGAGAGAGAGAGTGAGAGAAAGGAAPRAVDRAPAPTSDPRAAVNPFPAVPGPAPVPAPVDVRLLPGVGCQLVLARPAATPSAAAAAPAVAPTAIVWLALQDDELAHALAAAQALAPAGVASALLDLRSAGGTLDGARAAATAAWRQLRARSHGFAFPAPAWLAGLQRGGALAAQLPLAPNEGLRGRIVAGAALGPKALARDWPGAEAPDLITMHTTGAAPRLPLLVLQGAGDDALRRDESLHVAIQLVHRKLDVSFIEIPALATVAAWARLGGPDDVLLPMLRAFVQP